MRQAKIKELSFEDFAPYGRYANMINPKCCKLGEEPIEFYRDMVRLDLGIHNIALFSVCRVCNRPNVVDETEFHNGTAEGILPLDSDILIHVAPAGAGSKPPVELIEIFRVPRGTFVSLNAGVWHHAPFAYGSDVANTLVVLPERTYAVDCHVEQIPQADRVEII